MSICVRLNFLFVITLSIDKFNNLSKMSVDHAIESDPLCLVNPICLTNVNEYFIHR